MKTKPKSKQHFSDTVLKYEEPSGLSNGLNYLIGLVFMILNKIRHEFQGYKSARGFSSNLFEKAVSHDLNVVSRWYDYLKKYDEKDEAFQGKKILELGPGADLGVGLFLMAEGAKSYSTMDVHNLVKQTPPEIYAHLFDYLKKAEIEASVIEELQRQLELTNNHKNDRLNYQVTKDFDLSIFDENSFDLIVSNAAFQQFDHPEKSIAQFSRLVKPGAKFIALIDLKTHTRYIKSRDPLNIYRYSDFVYKPLRFKGSPNRMRPYEYESALRSNGWENITIFPRVRLGEEYVKKVSRSLNEKFRDPKNRMQNLTVVICATKP